MSKTCKIGVAGAGVFGGYHANKCAEHPRVGFMGIFDPSKAARESVADKHGVTPYSDFDALLASVDGVIIAAPAIYHGDMAMRALQAGKHVLVEKPVATDVETAQACIDIAAANDLVFQVGHQERFVARAIGLDKVNERPVHIRTERMGPFNVRGQDVSVTLDLMTHDLDLVLMLMGSMPDTVDGTATVIRTKQPDTSEGMLSWPGARAELKASRVADASSRIMTITYPSGIVDIDFNAKTLTQNTPFALNADFGGDPSAADSLGAATDSFVSAVLDGTEVIVTGQDGLHAMQIALMIDSYKI